MNSYDVIVLGLGGMGSAAAAHLAARGRRVLGLEKHSPAHSLGSSHGGSRIIRQSYFEHPDYVPLLLRSFDLFDRLGQDTGRDVHRLTGGLYLGPPECITVAGSLRAAREWDLAATGLTASEIRRRFPQFTPGDDEVGVYEEKAGFARPEETVRAHLQVADAAGADLHFEEPATRWRETPDGVEVVTDSGTYTAGELVICPGAWAPQVLSELGIPIRIERQVMYWFDQRGGTDLSGVPVYISESSAGEQIYGFPAIDGPGGGAKVAFFRKGADCTPETIDRSVGDLEVQQMRERSGRLLPNLPGELLTAVTCMYSTTPDEHFVITRPDGFEHLTVACGFSGHGFKFVPVVGEILADLATTGSTDHPIALFDPARLDPTRPDHTDTALEHA